MTGAEPAPDGGALEVRGLSAGYGDAQVLHDVHLVVRPGELVALVGANGAGKTTLLRCVSGLIRPLSGEIRFDGRALHALSAPAVVRLGIAHVPEGRQVFGGLTVADNLLLGAFSQLRRLDRGELAARIRAVCDLFPALGERLREPAGRLSGGQQQMLAIARGLMARPRLLLLDEPSLGLAPRLVAEIFDVLGRLRRDGVSVLLVEQNARASLSVADRGYVLETGRVVLEGTGTELLANPEVANRYLGVGGGFSLDGGRAAEMAARVRRVLTAVQG